MTISEMARGRDTASRGDLSVTMVIAGLAALAAVLHAFTPFNHDEAWFMEGARRLLDGGRLGTNIVDMNPLPVWWLSVVPVWLARQIGARIDVVATVFTALMAALSLVAFDRMAGADGRIGSARHVLLLLAAVLLLFDPGYDFGQREHWAVLLTLPYVVARSRRKEGAKLSGAAAIVIGIAAAFGFCFKPYFLLIPIALEIWLLAQTRRIFIWLCPETVAMAATSVAFAVLTVIYVPTYFEREMPNALLAYWAYNATLPDVLHAAVMLLIPVAAIALLGYSTRHRGGALVLAQAFAVAGAASLVAALLEMKPWSYHFLPSVLFFGLSAIVLLVTGTRREGVNTAHLGVFAIIVIMVSSGTITEAASSFKGDGTANRVTRLAAVFRANPGPNGTVIGFITSPRDVFPAVIASGAKWAAPFCCDYLIAAAARADEAPAAKRQAIRAAGIDQAKAAVSAARAQTPGVIVIAAGDYMLGFGTRKFDYVKWLEAHTDFADILRHYREISPIDSFRVFVRK